MSINYDEITHAESLGLTDDQSIADYLASRTASMITPQAARKYFRESDLWEQDPDIGYRGKLHNARKNLVNPLPIRDGLAELWRVVFGDASDSCGTTALNAHQVKGVVDFLVSTDQITQPEADGFFSLGRGIVHPEGVTAAEVVTVRQAGLDQERHDRAMNIFKANMPVAGSGDDASTTWENAWTSAGG